MRLSDLIRFVRQASQAYEARSLTDEERLVVIKAAFPRPDLLAWFDARMPAPPARYYLPLLVVQCGAQVGIRYGQQYGVFCAGEAMTRHLPAYADRPQAAMISWQIPPPGRPVAADWPLPPPLEVGQLAGFFDRPEPQVLAALEFCLRAGLGYCHRLIFLAEPVYERLSWTAAPARGERELFRGLFQDWNGDKTFLLYVKT